MANGLKITVEEFRELPQKKQMEVLFYNTEQMNRKIDDILEIAETRDGLIKFHRKIIYTWLGVITATIGTLLGFKPFMAGFMSLISP